VSFAHDIELPDGTHRANEASMPASAPVTGDIAPQSPTGIANSELKSKEVEIGVKSPVFVENLGSPTRLLSLLNFL
jgi:hypothetical protein